MFDFCYYRVIHGTYVLRTCVEMEKRVGASSYVNEC